MVINEKKNLWDKQALHYFRDTIQYIRKESSQNADKVKKEVLEKISELSAKPEIHNPDKYKTNNNGNYRAFELHRLRVSYLIQDNTIIMARVRNTRQKPLDY